MLRIVEKTRPLGRPVFMTFAEDMSYNHGPMISEAMFDEFMLFREYAEAATRGG